MIVNDVFFMLGEVADKMPSRSVLLTWGIIYLVVLAILGGFRLRIALGVGSFIMLIGVYGVTHELLFERPFSGAVISELGYGYYVFCYGCYGLPLVIGLLLYFLSPIRYKKGFWV